jgi:hypothetical protein
MGDVDIGVVIIAHGIDVRGIGTGGGVILIVLGIMVQFTGVVEQF